MCDDKNRVWNLLTQTFPHLTFRLLRFYYHYKVPLSLNANSAKLNNKHSRDLLAARAGIVWIVLDAEQVKDGTPNY